MAYPENFSIANAFTQKWEKGYVNHKNDPGGATYNGVSLRFLKQTGTDINGDGVIDAKDIEALYLAKDQARVDEIFYKAFWRDPKLDQYQSLPVQVAFYDANVNTGRTQSVKFFQRACNKMAGKTILVVDGIAGPKTLALFNQHIKNGLAQSLAQAMADFRLVFHNTLVNNSPYADGRDYRPFARGWRNRVNALREYIRNLK